MSKFVGAGEPRAFPLEAIEHPEKFYDGDVDYAWQRRQLEAGR